MYIPSREHNKKHIIIFILIGLAISGLITTILILSSQKEKKEEIVYVDCDHVLYANAAIEPNNKLTDKNDIHLLHARKNGLKEPISTNKVFKNSIDSLTENNILIKLQNNELYKIKRLSHSHPYLVPDAAQMVNEIATRFNEKIKEYNVADYRIMLTSLLRTRETQTKLSKRNVNAADNSAHLFATTIDISYKDFYNNDTKKVESNWEAIQALSKVLIEMREECKILAIRERKQSCFHITNVVCDPSSNENIAKNKNL
jgi:uncharacterized protein YcbK (DUF882 family)